MRRSVHRKIDLLKKNDEVFGIPRNQHLVESRAVHVLPHAQQIRARKFSVQAIRLQVERMTEARHGILTVRQDEKKIASGLYLLANSFMPSLPFNPDGFQEFLSLIAH